MPSWLTEKVRDHDGMTVEVKRQIIPVSSKPERMVSARVGENVYFERVDHSKWEGHCGGWLWMPGFLERAKKHFGRKE